MTTKIKYADVIADLEELVAEKGEGYVDPNVLDGESCVYKNTNESPSCIVGHVVDRHGLLDFLLPFSSAVRNWHIVYPAFATLFTPKALRALHYAQITQDGGDTWGNALRKAKETA